MTEKLVNSVILVKTHAGYAFKVAERLRKIPEVKEVYVVLGPYDLVLHLENCPIEKIGKLIVDDIQLSEGVTQTLTLVVTDTFNRST